MSSSCPLLRLHLRGHKLRCCHGRTLFSQCGELVVNSARPISIRATPRSAASARLRSQTRHSNLFYVKQDSGSNAFLPPHSALGSSFTSNPLRQPGHSSPFSTSSRTRSQSQASAAVNSQDDSGAPASSWQHVKFRKQTPRSPAALPSERISPSPPPPSQTPPSKPQAEITFKTGSRNDSRPAESNRSGTTMEKRFKWDPPMRFHALSTPTDGKSQYEPLQPQLIKKELVPPRRVQEPVVEPRDEPREQPTREVYQRPERYQQFEPAQPNPQSSRLRGSGRFADEDEQIDSSPYDRHGRRKSVAKLQESYRQAKRDDFELDHRAVDRIDRHRKRKAARGELVPKEEMKKIILPDYITVTNLAAALRVKMSHFADQLRSLGFEEFSPDHVIDSETAGLIAAEFGFEVAQQTKAIVEDLVATPAPEDTEYLLSRPPVITIMGHVDHGKTSLLDYLRKSSIVAGEFGGITQHIGAFTVPLSSGRAITVLDTPGHAAFEEMRARGANVTDIVILVVAADDSVKPQTIEAIKHAKAAGVQMIVAINKMDKAGANPEKVKQDLAQYNVQVEDFGGDVQTVNISAKTGMGIEDLEEATLALADVMDPRADHLSRVEGWIIEATQGASGKVATVLVRQGTIKPGCVIVCGTTWARVKSLKNEHGQTVLEAGPGIPVVVDGWREAPIAGGEVIQAESEQQARDVVELRAEKDEAVRLAADVMAVNQARRQEDARREEVRRQEEAEKARLAIIEKFGEDSNETDEPEDLEPKKAEENKIIQVPFIIRGDVVGSIEAVVAGIEVLRNFMIEPQILKAGVGSVSESDIELAQTANAAIVIFNHPLDGAMRKLAELAGVKIIEGNVIYRLTAAARDLIESRLPPLIVTKVKGEATVLQVFDITFKGRGKVPIAGSTVTNGTIERNSRVKVLRGDKVIYNGTINSLKNVKKDVSEMRKGTECGIGFEGFTKMQEGDRIQCFEENKEKRKL